MDIKRIVLGIVLLTLSGFAWATPSIQQWRLDNGVRVLFVESHELPMVELSLVFDAGSARDPQGKYGLAVMTAGLLDEGTDDKDADAIAQAFEALGALFGGSSRTDYALVTLRSLSQPDILQPATQLMREILTRPSFPAASLERERQRGLIGLRMQQQSPGSVAGKEFRRLMYGTHPYAHEPSGDVTGLQSIQRTDLQAHYQRYYVGSNAVLAVVGDLTPSQAKALSRRVAGVLPKGKAAPTLPKVVALSQPTDKRVTFPSSQTHVRMGQPGMTRTDPDYIPLYVGNYILGGGGLVSRMSEVIREKHGLSYSVYSYFAPLKLPGPFTMGLQTKNAQRDKAMALMRQTLNEFIQQGPTEDELDAAKKHLTGGFPLRIDSNKKIREYLTIIGFYDLPLSYLDDFPARVQAVTMEQIRDAFKRRIDADKLVTVIVGG